MDTWGWITMLSILILWTGLIAITAYTLLRRHISNLRSKFQGTEAYISNHTEIHRMQKQLLNEFKTEIEKHQIMVNEELEILTQLYNDQKCLNNELKEVQEYVHKEIEIEITLFESRLRELFDRFNEEFKDFFKQVNKTWQDFNFSLKPLQQEFTETRNKNEDIFSHLTNQRKQIERLSEASEGNSVQQKKIEDAISAHFNQHKAVESVQSQRVWFSAYAPQVVAPGSNFLLDIWAHTIEQTGMVSTIAQDLGRPQKVGVKAGLTIQHGAIITIKVSISAFNAGRVDLLFWDGEAVNASFPFTVPENISQGNHNGSASIFVEGMQIASLWFSIKVGSELSYCPSEIPVGIRQMNSAFASYASSDRLEVLARLQGIKKVAPDMQVFFDLFSLRSGENWQEIIAREVPTKDVFYLFWSEAAAKSDWVNHEWSLALTKRGLGYIDPIPLKDPRHIPPPDALSSLHFNDAYLAYIEIENQRRNAI